MDFISSVLIGVVVGVALIYAWSYFMRVRQSKRKLLKEDLLLVHSLTRDDLRTICGPSMPKWIKFTEYEEADWISQVLTELWPHIVKATSMVAKESIEPALAANKPASIKSLKFSKFSLGMARDYAPKVEGVRVHRAGAEADQTIMDLQIFWESDAAITLAVNATAVKLNVQVKNLSFVSTLRLIFQLGPTIPCIDAVVASLLRNPRPMVDFKLKAVGGSISAIPGLESTIGNIVTDVLESAIVWPERIVVPLNPSFNVKCLEMHYQGMLVVTVVKAEGLKNVDIIGKSDPYCKLWLNPKHVAKTTVIDNNLNPVWNETFELPVDDPHTAEMTLKIEDDDIMVDRDLGWALVPVADIYDKTEPYTVTIELLPKLHDPTKLGKDHRLGRITLRLIYRDFSEAEEVEVTEAEKARDPEVRDRAYSPDRAAASEAAAVEDAKRRSKEKAGEASLRRRGTGTGMATMGATEMMGTAAAAAAASAAAAAAPDDALPVSTPAGAPVVNVSVAPAGAAAAGDVSPLSTPTTPRLMRSFGDLKTRSSDRGV